MSVAKPEISASVQKVRDFHAGRAIATLWLSLWTGVGYLLGLVVYGIHAVIWALGFTLGWTFHAANYGFRNGARIKTEPKKRPSMPQ